MPRKIRGNGNGKSKNKIVPINEDYDDNNNYSIEKNYNENNNIREINNTMPFNEFSLPPPPLSRQPPLPPSPQMLHTRSTSRKKQTLGTLNNMDHDTLMHILGKQTEYPEFARLNTVIKRGLELEDMANMRNLYAMDFQRMSIPKMRKWCDELYMNLDRNGRDKRLTLLMKLGENTPEEFPKHLIDDSDTPSRLFYVLFTRGGEENKPSNIYKEFVNLEYHPRGSYELLLLEMLANGGITEDDENLQEVLRQPNRLNYSEYIQENERLYYTGMLKALLHPLGGGRKKRRTQRRRKTHRK